MLSCSADYTRMIVGESGILSSLIQLVATPSGSNVLSEHALQIIYNTSLTGTFCRLARLVIIVYRGYTTVFHGSKCTSNSDILLAT